MTLCCNVQSPITSLSQSIPYKSHVSKYRRHYYTENLSCILFVGNHAHIIKLKLVDNGLYVATRLASLTIPKSPLQFAENAEQWFADLLHFKVSSGYGDDKSYLTYNLLMLLLPDSHTNDAAIITRNGQG